MSLIIWLPLIKDIKNQGILNPNITTTGTIAYNAGKLGNALTFSNSAITLSPAPITKDTQEFSFAFWFNTTNVSATQCLYNGRTTTGGPVSVFLISGCWRLDDGTQHQFNSTSLTANTWNHIVITRDSSNIKLYQNGVLKQTMTATAFTTAGTSASIGMSSNSNTPSGNAIVGQVNDYRIYDHVLSVKEIKELSKGLMTHLKLDWGANPNMVKNSYTWMNKNLGSNNVMSPTKSVITDDTAPCKNVFKAVFNNTDTNAKSNAGMYYGIGAQGLATTDLVEGETYTYSFWAKADEGNTGNVSFAAAAICESQTKISDSGFGNLDTNWRLHTVTFNWTKTTKLTACFYMTIPASSTITIYLCGLKLEKGNKATPYIPHVEETVYTNCNYSNMYWQEVSGYNRTITKSGTFDIAKDCPKGTGTDFNKAKIVVADGFPVGTQTPFTIVYWHKAPTNTYGTWTDSVGLDVGNSSSTAASTQFRRESTNTTGSNYAWYGNGVVNNGGGDCSYAPTMDTWYHYAYTFNGTTFTSYINGVLHKTATLGDSYVGFKTYPRFYVGDTGTFYQQAADVRVYATCLSAEDIKELYQVAAQIDNTGKVYCNQIIEA